MPKAALLVLIVSWANVELKLNGATSTRVWVWRCNAELTTLQPEPD